MLKIVIGGCVQIPDGRIGRVREKINDQYKVRLRRKIGISHQFIYFKSGELKPIACPKGWMSIEGYKNYLKKTLSKMKKRMLDFKKTGK